MKDLASRTSFHKAVDYKEQLWAENGSQIIGHSGYEVVAKQKVRACTR
jgi:hypothetical protein